MRKLGKKVICPICGKPFKVTVDTCSFIGGDYVCSWNCFLKEVNRRKAEEQTKCK